MNNILHLVDASHFRVKVKLNTVWDMRNKIYWISLDQHHFRSETRAHLHNWRYEWIIQPSLQVKSLRILLRFPFYTDETWFTLLFPQKLVLATCLRLVISFFARVNELLNDEHVHFTMWAWNGVGRLYKDVNLLKYWTSLLCIESSFPIITIRNSSCGKVMFSQVSHSVHRGACMAKGGHA